MAKKRAVTMRGLVRGTGFVTKAQQTRPISSWQTRFITRALSNENFCTASPPAVLRFAKKRRWWWKTQTLHPRKRQANEAFTTSASPLSCRGRDRTAWFSDGTPAGSRRVYAKSIWKKCAGAGGTRPCQGVGRVRSAFSMGGFCSKRNFERFFLRVFRVV